MRGSIFMFCFLAAHVVEQASGRGGGGGGHGGGGGGHAYGGHGGGGHGGRAGGKSGGSGVIGAGITGAAVGVAIAPSFYHYNPIYYRYYYFYHGYHSHENYGPSEPQLPAATAQDKADAANIVNAQFSEKVIASILPFRGQLNRQVINSEIANHNNGKRLIPPRYLPNHKKSPVFKDLCFGLVNDPITVLTMYLGEFLHRRDETFIIIVLTLCQEMSAMHFIYNHKHKNGLTKRRKKQRHPFSNLMKVWVANDRDPEDAAFIADDVKNKAESLKKEYPHWKETRDELENTLIRKSLKFGLAVMEKFKDDLKMNLEDAIRKKIKNHDLVDAYTSLARYVNDKYDYMATVMLKHSDGTDRWAVWIMMIAITTRDDWPKIDVAFKKINEGVSLTDHILKTTEADRTPFEIMAAMIDPKYKPTYL